jgi:hypothetical protein
MAETKKDAFAALDVFVETWGVKYDKAVNCLVKDRASRRGPSTHEEVRVRHNARWRGGVADGREA